MKNGQTTRLTQTLRQRDWIWHFGQFALAIVLLCTVAFVSGCHRSYYRRQADAEAQRLIQEKSLDARWNNSSDGTIEINPMSRMFDPFSSDHPPLPPDDPASHQFMHSVNGKPGYPHWHANGDTSYVENPEWQAFLPINENGEVVLDLTSAFQLAQVHSPDLQQQRETLYLSALDVSLERFGFDSQLFSGFNSFLTTQGDIRGGGNSSTTLSNQLGVNGGGINLNRLGITGANLVVGLANTILWNFSGPNTQSATSLIDFTLIQPLLRGAGRSVILEALTQSERTLLANVRQMDRFRRGFYLEIVTGRNAGAGPNLGGNFLGTPGGATGGVGGYLGLLQTQQQIRIQEFNVSQLEDVLDQFREFFERERINAFQVRLFESTLYNAQQQLLQLKNNYQTQLDNFKILLGLPPRLRVIIRDPFLDRFEFISDEILARQSSINMLRSTTGEQLNRIDDLLPDRINDDENREFQWTAAINKEIEGLSPFIDQALQFIDKLASDDKTQLEEDFSTLEKARPKRLSYLKELRDDMASGTIEANVEPQILQAGSVKSEVELRQQLALALRSLSNTEAAIKEIKKRISEFDKSENELETEALYDFTKEAIVQETSERLTEVYNIALELSLLQAQARGNSIELPQVDLDDQQAITIARCFRRDWMNARSSLVDQWRQIEFVADALESQLDLVFEGEIGNVGDNPFRLRSSNGQLRGGIRFDSPIVRLNERNQYRQTLIAYQQAKRQFYQFEDAIHADLRDTLRSLNLNKILFELSRQNIQIQIEQVELARLSLEDPSADALGATTARDLTQAINGLQNAQSQFLNVWVTYEVLRRSLDFDLGTFQIGQDGSWIDPEVIDPAIVDRAAALMGIDISSQCYCDLSSIYQEDSFMGQQDQYSDEDQSYQYNDSDLEPQEENQFEYDNEFEPNAEESPSVDRFREATPNTNTDPNLIEGTELPSDALQPPGPDGEPIEFNYYQGTTPPAPLQSSKTEVLQPTTPPPGLNTSRFGKSVEVRPNTSDPIVPAVSAPLAPLVPSVPLSILPIPSIPFPNVQDANVQRAIGLDSSIPVVPTVPPTIPIGSLPTTDPNRSSDTPANAQIPIYDPANGMTPNHQASYEFRELNFPVATNLEDSQSTNSVQHRKILLKAVPKPRADSVEGKK